MTRLNLNRRQFTKGAFASMATIAIGGTKSSAKVLGANDKVRVALAGLNGRGAAHLEEYLRMKNVEIAWLVDPDSRTWTRRITQVAKNQPTPPKTTKDVRKALEDKNVDVVSIATPNHWHSLMTIWACQAGKDVYVEKPCSQVLNEGRIAVEVARKTNRIVQHGTQGRSMDSWSQLAEIVKSGRYGKLLVSRALCYKLRPSIGMKLDKPAPSEVDFDIWNGPAPKHSYNENFVHYNWHWFWDFGNGDIGNQGVHQMDVARWLIPGATLPLSVFSVGGRVGYKDQGQTPNTQVGWLDFGPDKAKLIFEVRGFPSDKYRGEGIGNILHFEQGVVAGGNFFAKGEGKGEPLPKVDAPKRGVGGGIFGNFIEAVRTRKRDMQDAEILEGHYSSACCHLVNVSYRLGQKAEFAPKSDKIPGGEAMQETIERMGSHLKARGIELDGTTNVYHLGKQLAFDPKREICPGDNDANALLSRPSRAGFAVPEKV